MKISNNQPAGWGGERVPRRETGHAKENVVGAPSAAEVGPRYGRK